MANPELSRHIQALPDELNALEGGGGRFPNACGGSTR